MKNNNRKSIKSLKKSDFAIILAILFLVINLAFRFWIDPDAKEKVYQEILTRSGYEKNQLVVKEVNLNHGILASDVGYVFEIPDDDEEISIHIDEMRALNLLPWKTQGYRYSSKPK